MRGGNLGWGNRCSCVFRAGVSVLFFVIVVSFWSKSARGSPLWPLTPEEHISVRIDNSPELDHVKLAWMGGLFLLLFLVLWIWDCQLVRESGRRQETFERLRDAEATYRFLFEHCPEGIILSDIDSGALIEFNDAAFGQLGYSRAEFAKLSLKNIVLDHDAFQNSMRAAGARISDVYCQCIKKDGIIRDFQVISQHAMTSSRDFYYSVWRDITETKKAQESLRQSESLLKIAGETARIGGWSVDLSLNRVTWSDEVALIHDMPVGYSPSVEEGIKFYAPEWREKISRVYGECASEGRPYDEEMEIFTAKGKRVWVRTIGYAIRDGDGRIIKVQGAFQDIHERRRITEDNMKHMRELEIFYKASIGREERILELKKQIEVLQKELGRDCGA